MKNLNKYNVAGEIIEAKTKKEAVEKYIYYRDNVWMSNCNRSFNTLYNMAFQIHFC